MISNYTLSKNEPWKTQTSEPLVFSSASGTRRPSEALQDLCMVGREFFGSSGSIAFGDLGLHGSW